MKTAFYAFAFGAALVLTASTASVQAEDRDCTVDLKAPGGAGPLRLERMVSTS